MEWDCGCNHWWQQSESFAFCLVFAETVIQIWFSTCFSALRWNRTRSMLGYLPSGNLFTVSFLISVALVSMVSVFMMPALAQLAGELSAWQVYFALFWKILLLITGFYFFLTEPATLSCSSSWWGWSRPQRMNWWRSWWWMCWKSALTFWPDTFRSLSIHTRPASKVLGRTMCSYLKRWEASFSSRLLLASSVLSFSENNYLIWFHMSDLRGPARGFHSLPNSWCHPSPSPALHD